MKKFTTTKFLIVSLASWALWEVWTFVDDVPENTISETIWGMASIKHGFLLRFASAFLFAHFFFQRVESAADTDPVFRLLKKHPALVTLCGLICGYLFWQRAPRLALSTTKDSKSGDTLPAPA